MSAKWQLEPAIKQLLFCCWTLDFIEFLTPTLTFVLPCPILTYYSQDISSKVKALSIALKRLSVVEQFSPDLVHMLKNFNSTLFDLSTTKMWVHTAFIFSRAVSLARPIVHDHKCINLHIGSQVRLKWRHRCIIQDASHFRSAACKTLCNLWVRKHFFIQLNHMIRRKKGYVKQ